MKQRGRKSSASLSIVAVNDHKRPRPPAHLSEPEADIWRSLTSAMPPRHFDSALFLLESLCCTINVGNVLMRELHRYDDPALKNPANFAIYEKLLAMNCRQSALVASLSTKLKLTKQTQG
jgi:hypothetical protein